MEMMNYPVVEGSPVVKKSTKGAYYICVWDGVHSVEVQFHAEDDVHGIIKALNPSNFKTVERDYGPDKKWSELVGPRATISFKPTGKSEDGSAVFAKAISAEATSLCTSLPGGLTL